MEETNLTHVSPKHQVDPVPFPWDGETRINNLQEKPWIVHSKIKTINIKISHHTAITVTKKVTFKRITTGKSHKVSKVMVGIKHQEATNNKSEANTGTIITIQSQVQKIQLKQIINLLHKVMVTNMCSKISTIPSWNKIPSPFINLQVPLIKKLLFKNMIEL